MQMLSPQEVEGAFLSSLAKHVQVGQQQKGRDKGKQKGRDKGMKNMHEDDPSEVQERYFVLVDHEVAPEVNVMDSHAQNPKSVKHLFIKEKEANIQALSANLERVKWIIKYLEQENK